MNKNVTIVIATLTLLVGGLSGYIIASKDGGFGKQAFQNQRDRDAIPAGMHQMADGMPMSDMGMDHSEHMMGMMVASEREFIAEMIPHHQEAVDTAKEVLERGATTPEIKQLVEGIVTAQEQEIAAMKQWYADWYGETYEADDGYAPMMRELESLSGAALDRAFLEDMIMHHMGAIMMARSVEPYIEHDEVRQLAGDIIRTQAEEITLMRTLMQGL